MARTTTHSTQVGLSTLNSSRNEHVTVIHEENAADMQLDAVALLLGNSSKRARNGTNNNAQ